MLPSHFGPARYVQNSTLVAATSMSPVVVVRASYAMEKPRHLPCVLAHKLHPTDQPDNSMTAAAAAVAAAQAQAPLEKQNAATKAADAASKQAQNTMSPGALKQVKLSNSQKYELEKYDKLSQIESEKSLECNVAYAQVAIVQHLILGIGLVALMSAARLFTTTAATSGELALLYSLLLRLLWPLHQFGLDIREGSKALSNIQGALEILDTKSKERSGTIPLPDWPPSLAREGQAEMYAPATAAASSFNGGHAVHAEQHDGPSSSSSSSRGGDGSGGSSSSSSISQPQTAQAPSAGLPGLEVELRDVYFAYKRTGRGSQKPEEQEVLRAASSHILSGERVGVKGRSGAGKTTTLDLILVFLRVAVGCGTVLVNGVDLRDLMLTSLWGSIALVSQDPEAQLRDATIMDNIRSSRRDASDEEVKAAAKVAQLEDLIKKLGDSTIGEGGSKLSKGQRQCIAIASAILKRPRLLVLDEPTSNLDYDTEAEILKNLRHELTHGSLKGCTCIIVSHRPSALELLGCDCVFELTAGGTLKEVQQGEAAQQQQHCAAVNAT